MSLYRNEKHAAVRAIAGDSRSLCSRAAWQGQYRAGTAADLLPSPEASEPLDFADRLLQDAMTRSLIRRALPEAQWLVLLTLHAGEQQAQAEAIRQLAACLQSPAGPRFRHWCIACWALPAIRRDYRQLQDWDSSGVSERTLRHWRQKIHAQLDSWRRDAFAHLEHVLVDAGLIDADPAQAA